MVIIQVFGKLVVEPKTLGFGNTLGKHFENDFKNLGVIATPLKSFQMIYKQGVGHGRWRSWWISEKWHRV
jgi:hypothetical protein